jgi:hypothetical protein
MFTYKIERLHNEEIGSLRSQGKTRSRNTVHVTPVTFVSRGLVLLKRVEHLRLHSSEGSDHTYKHQSWLIFFQVNSKSLLNLTHHTHTDSFSGKAMSIEALAMAGINSIMYTTVPSFLVPLPKLHVYMRADINRRNLLFAHADADIIYVY